MILFAFSMTTFALSGKLVFYKGDVKVIRDKAYISIKKKMKIESGDIIVTGRKSLALIKSKYTTIKVIQNSKMLLDFPTDDKLDATVDKGGAVIRLINKIHRNQNKRKKSDQSITINTRTAAMGVRGTEFFTYVGKNQNSILAVKEGIVDFRGLGSSRALLVEENKSTMTNQKKQTIDKRQMGIVDKVNWNLDDTSEDLSQPTNLFSHLEKVWENYKHEMEVKWSKYKDSQDKTWKNYINKEQGFKKLNN
jgi:hypothetical protein